MQNGTVFKSARPMAGSSSPIEAHEAHIEVPAKFMAKCMSNRMAHCEAIASSGFRISASGFRLPVFGFRNTGLNASRD